VVGWADWAASVIRFEGLEGAALLGGQEALDAAGAEALGVADRVAHVGELPVVDESCVHAAEDTQDVVAGGRVRAQAGVEGLDAAAGDFREGAGDRVAAHPRLGGPGRGFSDGLRGTRADQRGPASAVAGEGANTLAAW
jgi:hypothetical protein